MINKIKIKERHNKFPLVWLEITSAKNNGDKEEIGITEISYEDEEITSATEKETAPVFKLRLIETNQSFLVAKPKKGEVIIVRKPGKTDIFVSDLKLANKITVELNKIKRGWAPILWCTDSKLVMISALKTISKNKITGNIAPLIEKTMKDLYGDD